MQARRLHWIVGVAGLAAFVLTGQYMDRALGHLRGLPDRPRLLYRSAHIYLLLSSIVNMMLGLYLAPAATRRRRFLQGVGSILLIAGPPLFLWAFVAEPASGDLRRPVARPAIEIALIGALLHASARTGDS